LKEKMKNVELKRYFPVKTLEPVVGTLGGQVAVRGLELSNSLVINHRKQGKKMVSNHNAELISR